MADDVQSFEFKTALLSGRDNWTLDAGFLTRNGELFCSLDNVKRARFAQMTVRYSHSSWLDLHFEDRRQRISCNMHPGDESNREFLSLCSAILSDLAARKPGMSVAFGAGGGVRLPKDYTHKLREDAYPLDQERRHVKPRGRPNCPKVQLVTYGGDVIRYHRPLKVNPFFRERLQHFEMVVRQVGLKVYGRPPSAIRHFGAYVCRRISGRAS